MRSKLLAVKRRIVLLLLSTSFLYSCGDSNPCQLSAKVMDYAEVIDSIKNTPEALERYRYFYNDEYEEPCIFDVQNETYRFIWESSFCGTRIYRVEKMAKNSTLSKRNSAIPRKFFQ